MASLRDGKWAEYCPHWGHLLGSETAPGWMILAFLKTNMGLLVLQLFGKLSGSGASGRSQRTASQLPTGPEHIWEGVLGQDQFGPDCGISYVVC